jgi:hypothetical protein
MLLRLPTAEDCDRDWVLAVARDPELLDEAPLPIGLPITFTRGFDIDDEVDADELLAEDWLFDPDVDVWAKAVPLSIANAVAARSMCLIGFLLSRRGGRIFRLSTSW